MRTYRVARYAVRGTVAVRAGELKAELARGDALPFDKLILCNIGNPHAVQQKPITYYRQALTPCAAPLRHAPRATAGCARTQKQRTTMAPTTHPPSTAATGQVASALYSPELTKEGGGALASLYPEDVISRAKAYHAATNGSGVGAHSPCTPHVA
jgi:hypothetical protein